VELGLGLLSLLPFEYFDRAAVEREVAGGPYSLERTLTVKVVGGYGRVLRCCAQFRQAIGSVVHVAGELGVFP
jgi:hypothetical protein